jgi:hypothetical protein
MCLIALLLRCCDLLCWRPHQPHAPPGEGRRSRVSACPRVSAVLRQRPTRLPRRRRRRRSRRRSPSPLAVDLRLHLRVFFGVLEVDREHLPLILRPARLLACVERRHEAREPLPLVSRLQIAESLVPRVARGITRRLAHARLEAGSLVEFEAVEHRVEGKGGNPPDVRAGRLVRDQLRLDRLEMLLAVEEDQYRCGGLLAVFLHQKDDAIVALWITRPQVGEALVDIVLGDTQLTGRGLVVQLQDLTKRIHELESRGIPIGGIIAWWGDWNDPEQRPPGFELCDGNNVEALDSKLKGKKPDLLNRFPKGASRNTYNVIDNPIIGGANTIQLKHSHSTANLLLSSDHLWVPIARKLGAIWWTEGNSGVHDRGSFAMDSVVRRERVVVTPPEPSTYAGMAVYGDVPLPAMTTTEALSDKTDITPEFQ